MSKTSPLLVMRASRMCLSRYNHHHARLLSSTTSSSPSSSHHNETTSAASAVKRTGAGLFQRLSSFFIGAGLTALVSQFYIFQTLQDGNKLMLEKQVGLEKRINQLEKLSSSSSSSSPPERTKRY